MGETYRLLRTRSDTVRYYLGATWVRIGIVLACLGLLAGGVTEAVPHVKDALSPDPVVTEIHVGPNETEIREAASELATAQNALAQAEEKGADMSAQTSALVQESLGRVSDNSLRQTAADAVTTLDAAREAGAQVESSNPSDYTEPTATIVEATTTTESAYTALKTDFDTWVADKKAEEEAAAATPAPTQAPAKTQAPVPTQAPARTQAPVQTQAPAKTQAPVATPAAGARISVTCDRASVISVTSNGSITVNGSSVASGGTASGSSFSISSTGNSLSWGWVSGGNCS